MDCETHATILDNKSEFAELECIDQLKKQNTYQSIETNIQIFPIQHKYSSVVEYIYHQKKS